jgi:flavodoxin
MKTISPLDRVHAILPAEDVSSETKVLVVYFSATGNTESIAGYIADEIGADKYEIIPEEPYTSADLNYSNSSSRATLEQNDASARPAISGSVENMDDYDIIFLGYPIWWGQAPKIMYTFLESYDFSGKTIVPFCTSASSGIGSSASNLHGCCSDRVTWLSGNRFSSSASQSTVTAWINGLELDSK